MHFFNFGNDETFHFFKWVTTSNRVDHEGLIRGAFAQVEDDPRYEIGMDVTTVACHQLADILSDRLEQEVIDWSGFHHILLEAIGDGGGVDEFASSGDYDSADSLFIPLIETALSKIDCTAVARALLMQAGKWAPDRDRPEVL